MVLLYRLYRLLISISLSLHLKGYNFCRYFWLSLIIYLNFEPIFVVWFPLIQEMGLSYKQVSSDHGINWSQTLLQEQSMDQSAKPSTGRQQLQQQSEPLKCPRCDSMNTKFCYYNNYNKSQPRHFCKSCKRHWTKGGTLRNVPVGGGRKKKALKTSKTTAKATTTSTINGHIINRVNPQMIIQAQQTNQAYPLPADTISQPLISPISSIFHQNSAICNNGKDSLFSSSNLILPENHELHFPYSSSSSFDSDPSSVSTSFQSPDIYNCGAVETREDSIITGVMPATSCSTVTHDQLGQITRAMDRKSYWDWDDIDNFISSTDVNMQWDDSELIP